MNPLRFLICTKNQQEIPPAHHNSDAKAYGAFGRCISWIRPVAAFPIFFVLSAGIGLLVVARKIYQLAKRLMQAI